MQRKTVRAVATVCFVTVIAGIGFSVAVYGDEDKPKNVLYVYPGPGLLAGQHKALEKSLGVHVLPLTDEMIEQKKADFSSCRLLYLLGARGMENKEDKDRFRQFIASVKKQKPDLTIVMSEQAFTMLKQSFPDLAAGGAIAKDAKIDAYSGFSAISKENMKRLLVYLAVTYMGRPGKIEAPVKYKNRWFYHPGHEGTFAGAEEFLQWSQGRGMKADAPRALIETNLGHVIGFNRKVIDALIFEFEKQGMVAVAMNTIEESYEKMLTSFKPDVLMILTGKSGKIDFYLILGVPRLQPLFLMGESIDQWRSAEAAEKKRPPGGMGMMLVTRESQGIIETRVVAGPLVGGQGFTQPNVPIPDRMESFVARAAAYVRLARKPEAEKKIAVQYLGPPDKAEMLLGTEDTVMADSIINLLKRMKQEGYSIDTLPRDQEELVGWMVDHGHQILSSAPAALDKLARSGKAVLLPVETYRQWFDTKVPKAQREAVIKEWGKVPGEFMVWKDDKGKPYIVIPKIDLGNVVLVPKQFPEIEGWLEQDVRKELLHRLKTDPYSVIPSHNDLATNFWIEEGFKADALIVWEFFIMDYTLPRKMVGLDRSDWPDILMGSMPNVRVWPLCEMHWSLPAKRRTTAVLVDHLTSPDTTAGLSDELLNLSNDIVKWDLLPEGALEAKFRASITKQVKDANLDEDLHFDLKAGKILGPDEIRKVAAYLGEVQHEKINVNYHVLGQPPPADLLVPYLASCVGSRFLDGLKEVIPVPPDKNRLPGDMKKYLRQKAEEVIGLVFDLNLSPSEAVVAAGGKIGPKGLPVKIKEGLDTARLLSDGFAKTHMEIDNILAALDGKFVPPGPGNLPERNPAVVPTGRNMYIMNPDEIPSRVSWELGKQLVDQMLAEKLKADGRYPEKVGLSLDFRSTMMDYGVMESQILYLIGVRPLWDSANRVLDFEVVPAQELGRPRIDVFIETYDYYVDYLESRLHLLDKAVRTVSALDEPENYLFRNHVRVSKELQEGGMPPENAETLSHARIFAMAPELVSFVHFFLLEETGDWDARKELVDVYLAERDYVYTEGSWGKKMPEAYQAQIQGTQVVLKNVVRGGPLVSAWYNGGNLSLVIKELTGKAPDYYISDLRDPGEEKVVRAEDAMKADIRATLFNRQWIEGMMKEGYAGGQQMAGRTFSTLGWEINRENSVSDDIWKEIVDIYLRDKKNMKIREWFDDKNPYAFQGMTEILLEAIRKGYWNADEAMRLEIAAAYAESVIRHGKSEEGAENKKFEAFLEKTLKAPGSKKMDKLLADYKAKAKAPGESSAAQEVKGKKMVQVQAAVNLRRAWPYLAVGLAIMALLALGIWRRFGGLR